MRIGIIGSGKIGSTLGAHWARAGHEVFYSSRHPEQLADAVKRTGKNARAGTIREAADFGEVLLLAVPYVAMPEVAETVGPHAGGKVVLDAGNIVPSRDGELAAEVKVTGKGSGAYTALLLPGTRVVKAFNTVYFRTLEMQSNRPGEKVGVPLAGDDPAALEVAGALVRDAGFDPVAVGPLSASARLDFGSPVWNTNMTAAQVKKVLEL